MADVPAPLSPDPPPAEVDPLAEVVIRFVDTGDPLDRPGYPDRSAAVRLRQLLKYALRICGYRSEGFEDGGKPT